MKNIFKTIGPGILFASTAIGVSHLVQSTRAGANFGFTLLWAVVLANLLKYPFFEFGSRYASATGRSIIHGYKRLGNKALFIYFLITVVSMFLVTAAVGFVTAGFLQNLFQFESIFTSVCVVFAGSAGVLIMNNFKFLDRLIKITAVVLLTSTVIAFVMVLTKGAQGSASLWSLSGVDTTAYFAFLIPLMGWMPTAVDLSTWNSLWTVEKIKSTGYHPKLKETLFDFNLGYIISALLAICFVTLGAYLIFGTGTQLSSSAGKFSAQIISLYTTTFGKWAEIIMGASAFSIMLGTSLGVFDGYARAGSEIADVSGIAFFQNGIIKKSLYRYVLLIVGVGAFGLVYLFLDNPNGFKMLVNLATSISFLFAPVVAIMNWRLVQKKYIGEAYVPSRWLQILSGIGILFLTGFTLYYLIFECYSLF